MFCCTNTRIDLLVNLLLAPKKDIKNKERNLRMIYKQPSYAKETYAGNDAYYHITMPNMARMLLEIAAV